VAADRDGDVDLVLLGIKLGRGRGLDVGVAGVAVHRLHGAEVLRELGAVEPVPGLGADHLAQAAPAAERLHLFTVRVALKDAEASDLVARALLDRDRDLDARAVGREHHSRREDLHREVAAVVIERVDDEDVALEGVCPERAARSPVEDRRGPRDHDLAELAVGDVVVPDERDAADRDGLVLLDGELDDHLVVALRDDLVRDLGEEVALLGVFIAELLDAAADGGVAQDGPDLDLDAQGLDEILLLDLLVARELDGLDARALAHEDAEVHAVVAAVEVDLDVLEEARVPELAHVLGGALGGEWLPDAEVPDVREDVVGRDAAVTDDRELGDGLSARELALGERDGRGSILIAGGSSGRHGRAGRGRGRGAAIGVRRRARVSVGVGVARRARRVCVGRRSARVAGRSARVGRPRRLSERSRRKGEGRKDNKERACPKEQGELRERPRAACAGHIQGGRPVAQRAVGLKA
jgi:hypothetical protein